MYITLDTTANTKPTKERDRWKFMIFVLLLIVSECFDIISASRFVIYSYNFNQMKHWADVNFALSLENLKRHHLSRTCT